MLESVNRYGVLPEESAPAPLRSATITDPEPEADPTSVRHPPHVDSDSEDPKHPAAKASPTPSNPVRPCPTPSLPSAPANLDPALVDHRNRPWPPCEDHELAQYKMDTKSRPSWKTIAKRLDRTVEGCQARWQWLKNTRPELLHPGNATEAGDDRD